MSLPFRFMKWSTHVCESLKLARLQAILDFSVYIATFLIDQMIHVESRLYTFFGKQFV